MVRKSSHHNRHLPLITSAALLASSGITAHGHMMSPYVEPVQPLLSTSHLSGALQAFLSNPQQQQTSSRTAWTPDMEKELLRRHSQYYGVGKYFPQTVAFDKTKERLEQPSEKFVQLMKSHKKENKSIRDIRTEPRSVPPAGIGLGATAGLLHLLKRKSPAQISLDNEGKCTYSKEDQCIRDSNCTWNQNKKKCQLRLHKPTPQHFSLIRNCRQYSKKNCRKYADCNWNEHSNSCENLSGTDDEDLEKMYDFSPSPPPLPSSNNNVRRRIQQIEERNKATPISPRSKTWEAQRYETAVRNGKPYKLAIGWAETTPSSSSSSSSS